MSRTIQSLSSELWCEIFEFFDAIELYRTFGNLNSRINSILSEITPLYFDVITTEDYYFVSNFILPTEKNHANVKSIKFYEEFQIEEFFTRWPFSTFQQLRYLSLVYRGELSCDCSIVILQELSRLASLKSLHIHLGRIAHYDRCLKELLQLIFIEHHAFLSLKQFVIRCNDNRHLIDIPFTTIIKQTKLEFITLPSLYLHNFMEILPSIPYIKSVKINRLYSDFDRTISLPVYSPTLILSDCIYLNLNLDYHITFEELKLLFKKLPKLYQMKITCDYILSNGDQWETLLTENCCHLQKFQINFSLQYQFYNRPAIDNPQKSFSTLFWLDQNVDIIHNEEKPFSIVRFQR
ncbi:hypothetical protein I4U23_004036 [Adineta vaga]|nr:hypothetical protein I4U23_004036 [Adineta vaga]